MTIAASENGSSVPASDPFIYSSQTSWLRFSISQLQTVNVLHWPLHLDFVMPLTNTWKIILCIYLIETLHSSGLADVLEAWLDWTVPSLLCHLECWASWKCETTVLHVVVSGGPSIRRKTHLDVSSEVLSKGMKGNDLCLLCPRSLTD